ncbi:hypothetical protein HDU92_000493 [Lobulomyces angularis]|nr:hypothetical protein HDU92_000493 [Lobulomyces angularis]
MQSQSKQFLMPQEDADFFTYLLNQSLPETNPTRHLQSRTCPSLSNVRPLNLTQQNHLSPNFQQAPQHIPGLQHQSSLQHQPTFDSLLHDLQQIQIPARMRDNNFIVDGLDNLYTQSQVSPDFTPNNRFACYTTNNRFKNNILFDSNIRNTDINISPNFPGNTEFDSQFFRSPQKDDYRKPSNTNRAMYFPVNNTMNHKKFNNRYIPYSPNDPLFPFNYPDQIKPEVSPRFVVRSSSFDEAAEHCRAFADNNDPCQEGGSSEVEVNEESKYEEASSDFLNGTAKKRRNKRRDSQIVNQIVKVSSDNGSGVQQTEMVVKTRYMCTWKDCEKTFSTSGHVARHERIHLQIKPHKCEFPGCEQYFSRPDNKKQHYKTHFEKVENGQKKRRNTKKKPVNLPTPIDTTSYRCNPGPMTGDSDYVETPSALSASCLTPLETPLSGSFSDTDLKLSTLGLLSNYNENERKTAVEENCKNSNYQVSDLLDQTSDNVNQSSADVSSQEADFSDFNKAEKSYYSNESFFFNQHFTPETSPAFNTMTLPPQFNNGVVVTNNGAFTKSEVQVGDATYNGNLQNDGHFPTPSASPPSSSVYHDLGVLNLQQQFTILSQNLSMIKKNQQSSAYKQYKKLCDSAYKNITLAIDGEEKKEEIETILTYYQLGIHDLKQALNMHVSFVEEKVEVESTNIKLKRNLKDCEDRILKLSSKLKSTASKSNSNNTVTKEPGTSVIKHTINNAKSFSNQHSSSNLPNPLKRQQSSNIQPSIPNKSSLNTKKYDSELCQKILNDVVVHKPNVNWDDIVGLETAKRNLREIVILPSIRPELFTGLRSPAKGVLLFGPPGTGKTMLAKAVAHEANATFFSISASTLTSKYVGEGEKMVKALFAMARELAPSIIFIDEIDSILTERSESEHEASRRLKTQFLLEFDGLSSNNEEKSLLVLGATNRPQELDEAALRRLVKRIYIPLPEPETREALLHNLLKGQNHCISKGDLQHVVSKTEGYSGSDLTALAREASLGPIRMVKHNELLSLSADAIRPINKKDFLAAMSVIRPSVSGRNLESFLDWKDKFGTSGN